MTLDIEYVTLTELAAAVPKVSEFRFADVKSDRKFADLVIVRRAFCVAANRFSRHSLPAIGRFINREHTTVAYLAGRLKNRKGSIISPEAEAMVDALMQATCGGAVKTCEPAVIASPRPAVMPFPPAAEKMILSGAHISRVTEAVGYRDDGWETHKRNNFIRC